MNLMTTAFNKVLTLILGKHLSLRLGFYNPPGISPNNLIVHSFIYGIDDRDEGDAAAETENVLFLTGDLSITPLPPDDEWILELARLVSDLLTERTSKGWAMAISKEHLSLQFSFSHQAHSDIVTYGRCIDCTERTRVSDLKALAEEMIIYTVYAYKERNQR